MACFMFGTWWAEMNKDSGCKSISNLEIRVFNNALGRETCL